MNTWLQTLRQHNAQIDDNGVVSGFEGSRPGELPRGFVAPLTDAGLVVATGDDAPAFLHNQLTNDVERLGPEEARLAGYCSPKGRLLATLLMWKTAAGIHLQLPRQIQPAVQKRLQMYVLRAKVKLADASDAVVLLGAGGEPAAGLLKTWFPQLPAAPLAKTDSEHGTLIRLSDAFGQPRYQWAVPAAAAAACWTELVKTLTPVGTPLWRLTDIHAGVPLVTQATQEQFVPQMINFELIGGVNFKKGCYPGQEVVARSQYLGKLKRRMLLASVDALEVKPGTELFWSGDPDQPYGMVVNAERNFGSGSDILAELKLAATEEGTIHLGSASGPALSFLTLPYALPA
ncbi:MAG TPA: folate-binding protein [Noviherbaspirillum sp.]|uniref:CAF17-like 4Fe-4S cluster assembly/insertion protein YgfZ n=1 Tax=Noviherbaspirillum sp. TaxID=1926288 RepID=UPI002D66F18C|nr:folate-binding protein [Noviherbaspirillum sp.]HYD95777.1 folate-binding protein [Noviherbaspirillum sp.]